MNATITVAPSGDTSGLANTFLNAQTVEQKMMILGGVGAVAAFALSKKSSGKHALLGALGGAIGGYLLAGYQQSHPQTT